MSNKGFVTIENFENLQELCGYLLTQLNEYTGVQGRNDSGKYHYDSRNGWQFLQTTDKVYCSGSATADCIAFNTRTHFSCMLKTSIERESDPQEHPYRK